VLALAAQMRTHVADRGDVALLVARDWYDDGARDLISRFGALDEARLALDAIAPSQLVPRLVEALGHPLDDLTLPLVLALPALRARSALIVPLAPHVLAARTPAVHVAAAQLALDADEPALADRLLGDHAGAVDLSEGSWPLGATLARLRPSYALARLRATRARGVRSWHDEPHLRIAIAAVAMAALRRPGKARALYRQALTGAPSFVSLILPPYFAAHVFDEPGDLAAPPRR